MPRSLRIEDVVDDSFGQAGFDRQVVEDVVPDDRRRDLGDEIDVRLGWQLAASDGIAEQHPGVFPLLADDRAIELRSEFRLPEAFGHQCRQHGTVRSEQPVDERLHHRQQVGPQVTDVRQLVDEAEPYPNDVDEQRGKRRVSAVHRCFGDTGTRSHPFDAVAR